MRSLTLLVLTAVALALGCGSPEERGARHRANADEYFENEQWNEAKVELLNLLQTAPGDADSHYKMGLVHFKLREYAEGIRQLEEAVRFDPDNTAWRLELAQVLFSARAYGEALQHVDAPQVACVAEGAVERGNFAGRERRGGGTSAGTSIGTEPEMWGAQQGDRRIPSTIAADESDHEVQGGRVGFGRERQCVEHL